MIRVLLLLALLTLLGAGADLVAPYRADPVEVSVGGATQAEHAPALASAGWIPLDSARGDRMRVRARHAGTEVGGRIEFDLATGVLYSHSSGRDRQGLIGAGYSGCVDAGALAHCSVPFRVRGEQVLDLGAASPNVQVANIRTTAIKVSLIHPLTLTSIFVLYAALAILGALFLLLRLAPSTKLWLLSAAGAGWLVATGHATGVATLVLVALLGVMLARLIRTGAKTTGVLAATGCILGVFVVANTLSNATAGIWANPGGLPLPVPLGLAFFTIRALDITFRVATREIRELPVRDYLAYMLFPSTLPAGPIYRYDEFRRAAIPQCSIVDWAAGLARAGIGVLKKVLCDTVLTRFLGSGIMQLYANPDGDRADLWIVLVLNALYVYLDFSAYSDIAIGVGRMLGWHVPENFDWPFLRPNLREFWQRWHITLSRWVSRWVHLVLAFPLRHAPAIARHSLPVLGSLLCIGLWHELQLTWVLWGLHHGMGILISDAIVALPGLLAISFLQSSQVRAAARIIGVAGVVAWVSLSHCFTLSTDPAIAMRMWLHALGIH